MTAAPAPRRPVRGSATGRPLMAALDLFGRRWTLRILWELRDQALGFRPLQQRCDGMSSSVLHQRLTELQETRLIERDLDGGYRLTALGRDASHELRGLHRWSERWAAELDRTPPDGPEAEQTP
ncbi:winged helix-turn-helix transcriptional regulator [Streptomyces melanogenes]|uniref:winged helix-turn-helix transcriptional regulator n=1 Tax=Streptomyces melanogenes TaxID=67326 RepID=UPI00227D7E88|nr:helix-turn-helix domain-containing protein [Streptomyces melanogenes]